MTSEKRNSSSRRVKRSAGPDPDAEINHPCRPIQRLQHRRPGATRPRAAQGFPQDRLHLHRAALLPVDLHARLVGAHGRGVVDVELHQLGRQVDAVGAGLLDGADALVVCTEWNEFRHPDFDRIRSLMKAPVVFDGRNVYVANHLPSKGFTYYAVGIPHVSKGDVVR